MALTSEDLENAASEAKAYNAGRDAAHKSISVLEREIWNNAVETVATNLKLWYPDHAAINAYCAAARSLKR